MKLPPIELRYENSLLEAMASGCLVIGSDTAPVREVLRHGENGWLVDFFDDSAMAEQIVMVLDDPAAQAALRRQARAEMLMQYSLRRGLKGYNRLLDITALEIKNPASDIPKILMQQRQPGRYQSPFFTGARRLWKQIA